MNQPIRFTTSPEGHLGDCGGHSCGACRAYVTQRTGGVSPHPFRTLNLGTRVNDDPVNLLENEHRVLTALGAGPPARADLVHGIRTAVVDSPGVVPETDALVTNVPGLPLALTVADCYPVAATIGAWRGLAHCGWRGVAGGIVEELLRVLRLHASGPARVWIGPGIGVCCYEVGPEVASVFPRSTREQTEGSRSVRLDLAGEIRLRLTERDVAPEDIATSGLCTACNTDIFFSHRAEGPTGRMSAYFF